MVALLRPPYSPDHPKRLWIQHILREFRDPQDLSLSSAGVVKRDSGIWITAFDFLRFSSLTNWAPSLDGRHANRGDGHGGASGCDLIHGGCYLSFPYYFPIADVLTGTHYLPAPDPIAGTAKTEPLSTRGGGVEDRVGSMGAAQFGDLPRVTVHSEQISWNVATKKRRVRVTITGPDHMSLVLRDSEVTQPEPPKFSGGTTTDESATVRSYSLTQGGSSVLVGWSITDGALPPPRFEGVRLVQLTHGTLSPRTANTIADAETLATDPQKALEDQAQAAWGRRCEYSFDLDIKGRGGGGVALTVVGHYTGLKDTPALRKLDGELPDWARGGAGGHAIVRTK